MGLFTLDEWAYRVLPQLAPGRAIADREWRTLRLIADAISIDLPFQIDPGRGADNVERFLCEGRLRRAWRCRDLLTWVEAIPYATRRRSFSALSSRERRHLFEERIIDGEGLSGICAKVRYLVLMGAYGDESVPSSLGVRRTGEARPLTRVRRAASLPFVG